MEELVNIGETLFSLVGGRRKSVSSALSKRRQTSQTEHRLEQAQDKLERLEEQRANRVLELDEKKEALRDQENSKMDDIEEKSVRPKKKDIDVRFFGVLWVPTLN